MGRILYTTPVIAYGQIRMMVLAMGNPGSRIHESHGLIIIFELVILSDRVIQKLPSFELLHQFGYLGG